jgi:imidazolonepropionase-like amidohydrolase
MKRQSVIGFALLACGFVGSCLGADGQKVVVIHAGQLFVGKSDGLLSNQVIVIQGDRIAEVGPAGSVKVPAGAEEIDLGKATVLPGLIDGHAHMFKMGKLRPRLPIELTTLHDSWQYDTILAVKNVKTDLEAGITSARDMMSMGAKYSDVDVKRAINEGVIPGPREQVATVALMGTAWALVPGFSPEVTIPSVMHEVDSPWEGRKAVRENVKYGADLIKIFMNSPGSELLPDGTLQAIVTMNLEEEKAIVDEAHRHGLKAACNAKGGPPTSGSGIALRESIEAGCDTIEEAFDYDPESISKMAAKGIFMGLMLNGGKAREASDLKATHGKNSRAALQRASFQRGLKAGVKIPFVPNEGGGDGVDHGEQAKELVFQVEYGMTPAQALRSATSVNAEMMGWQDRVGSIEKGKYADIIAVSGNPLDDITELERVKFVMKGGEIVRNNPK